MAVSEEEIIWSYRMILGRKPESPNAIRRHINSPSAAALRDALIRSPEFSRKYKQTIGAKRPPGLLSLDVPANDIEYEATEDQLRQCLAKIKAAWSHLGIARPHFSVLTNKKFLPQFLDKNLSTFWASGEAEIARIEKMLTRQGFGSLSSKTCVEFGCGVGRVTVGLASRFALVHGYDISPSHLALAEQRALELNISNCRYHLCSDNILDPLAACNFFYSRIVFQHNPPPVIRHLIRIALAALKPGGLAIFQVPTYRKGYRFAVGEWLGAKHKLDMQMHCLPQHVIFAIVREAHCEMLEVREDGFAGDQFISNTFMVRKLT